MSVVYAGYCVFPISPRNSAIAVATLMKQAGVKHLLVGREQITVDLASNALKHLEGNLVPSMSPMLVFNDLFSGPSVSRDDVPYFRKPLEEIVVYLHSSGDIYLLLLGLTLIILQALLLFPNSSHGLIAI